MDDYGSLTARGVIYDSDKGLFVVTNQWVPNHLVLPGGGIEPGEAITDGLKREIAEELGVEAIIGNLIVVHQIKKDDKCSAPSFIFHITNHEDFENIKDLTDTTHGQDEIDEFKFTDDYSLVLPQEVIPLLDNIQDNQCEAPAVNLITPEVDQY
jgi:ADP-ribose pyrophosphatase YjhB (NUDIX family)